MKAKIDNLSEMSKLLSTTIWYRGDGYDLSCSYIYRKIEFQLSGRNIFNNNAFERLYISDFTETSIHYTLRPMEVMAKVLFSF